MAAQEKRWLELVTANYSFREDYANFYTGKATASIEVHRVEGSKNL